MLGKGYTLLTRRYKARHGEIDIVAMDGDTLVFVEVKMRSGFFELPEDSVTSMKIDRFQQAVAEYFESTGTPEVAARYDLVGVSPTGIKHYKDAFR